MYKVMKNICVMIVIVAFSCNVSCTKDSLLNDEQPNIDVMRALKTDNPIEFTKVNLTSIMKAVSHLTIRMYPICCPRIRWVLI